VILVCAAFVHHQKREDSVALSVLERAARQLDFPSREYDGVDVLRINWEVRQILETRKFSNFTI
jgi:hypothetical protein